MKYSIEGFSQKRLIENNLGLKDSYILRWLVDFSKSGKMVTLDIKNSDGTSKTFFWVKYAAILNDLPILEINNTRIIARHFDKLAGANLLEKHIEKRIDGTYTYFHINYRELEKYCYTKTNDIIHNNDNLADKNKKDSTESENSTKEIASTELHSNLVNEITEHMRTVSKSTPKRPLLHSSSTLLPKEQEKAAAMYISLETMCKDIAPDLILNTRDYAKMAEYMIYHSLDADFLHWIYNDMKSKEFRNKCAYFRKVFFEKDLLDRYKQHKLDLANKDNTRKDKEQPILCPVCNTLITQPFLTCPGCGINPEERTDENEIKHFKWKRTLDPKVLRQYENECKEIYQNSILSKVPITESINSIRKKYGYSDYEL